MKKYNYTLSNNHTSIFYNLETRKFFRGCDHPKAIEIYSSRSGLTVEGYFKTSEPVMEVGIYNTRGKTPLFYKKNRLDNEHDIFIFAEIDRPTFGYDLTGNAIIVITFRDDYRKQILLKTSYYNDILNVIKHCLEGGTRKEYKFKRYTLNEEQLPVEHEITVKTMGFHDTGGVNIEKFIVTPEEFRTYNVLNSMTHVAGAECFGSHGVYQNKNGAFIFVGKTINGSIGFMEVVDIETFKGDISRFLHGDSKVVKDGKYKIVTTRKQHKGTVMVTALYSGNDIMLEHYEKELSILEYYANKEETHKKVINELKNKLIKFYQYLKEKRLSDQKIEQLDNELVVTVQDAIDAGNCKPGIERFIKDNLDGKEEVKVKELKQFRHFNDVYRVLIHMADKQFTN